MSVSIDDMRLIRVRIARLAEWIEGEPSEMIPAQNMKPERAAYVKQTLKQLIEVLEIPEY